MVETSDTSDVVKKQLMPEDTEFPTDWMKVNDQALTELAAHFCRGVRQRGQLRRTAGEGTWRTHR